MMYRLTVGVPRLGAKLEGYTIELTETGGEEIFTANFSTFGDAAAAGELMRRVYRGQGIRTDIKEVEVD